MGYVIWDRVLGRPASSKVYKLKKPAETRAEKWNKALCEPERYFVKSL